MPGKLWSIVVWSAAAAFVSLGGNWMSAKDFPGWWVVIGWGIVAVAQGLLAAKLFTDKPPE